MPNTVWWERERVAIRTMKMFILIKLNAIYVVSTTCWFLKEDNVMKVTWSMCHCTEEDQSSRIHPSWKHHEFKYVRWKHHLYLIHIWILEMGPKVCHFHILLRRDLPTGDLVAALQGLRVGGAVISNFYVFVILIRCILPPTTIFVHNWATCEGEVQRASSNAPCPYSAVCNGKIIFCSLQSAKWLLHFFAT